MDVSLLQIAQGPDVTDAQPIEAGSGPELTKGGVDEVQADPEPCQVSIDVTTPGKKLMVPMGKPWSGEAKDHFYFDRSSRELEFAWGPRRFKESEALKGCFESLVQGAKAQKTQIPRLVLEPKKGTTVSDAAWVMDLALSNGLKQIAFTSVR